MTSFAASFLAAAAQCPTPSPAKPGSPPLTGALFGAASASATLAPGAPSGNGISGPAFGDVEMTCAAGGDRGLGCNGLPKGPETARKSKARKVRNENEDCERGTRLMQKPLPGRARPTCWLTEIRGSLFGV